MLMAEMIAEQETMKKAFSLVSPDATRGAHWKDYIDAIVTDEQLATAGVALDDVLKSVAYMTGTSARVVAIDPLDRLLGVHGTRIKAPGYWAGPCN